MSLVRLEDGRQLFYQRFAGEAGRPCLVFLHEGLGCTAMWGDFPEQVCARTRCPGLVYDRIGHGQSGPETTPRTVEYLHRAAQVELPQVLAALIPGQRYLLIGHSDGGSISLIHGARQPEGLVAIITVAAHILVEEMTVAGVQRAREAWDAGRLRQGLARYHGEKSEALFLAWAEIWTSPAFRSWSIEGLLAKVTVPVLVLQGTEDQYGSEAQVEGIVSRTGGTATPLLLEDCGHSPHLDFPELTLDLVACYVNRQAR